MEPFTLKVLKDVFSITRLSLIYSREYLSHIQVSSCLWPVGSRVWAGAETRLDLGTQGLQLSGRWESCGLEGRRGPQPRPAASLPLQRRSEASLSLVSALMFTSTFHEDSKAQRGDVTPRIAQLLRGPARTGPGCLVAHPGDIPAIRRVSFLGGESIRGV